MLVDSSSPSTTSSVSFGFILYSFLWILEGLVQLQNLGLEKDATELCRETTKEKEGSKRGVITGRQNHGPVGNLDLVGSKLCPCSLLSFHQRSKTRVAHVVGAISLISS
ncbi:hypothetical protein Fcan01_07978 [Folsomia candida]|uniref:Uncharacterized protein n=1 Tax=Folsomia candida TaxID=158441 RepID=A0A226EKK3_FOLCA|nr:hypothetical protein Fcan01_07978 [Folsomia candida]